MGYFRLNYRPEVNNRYEMIKNKINEAYSYLPQAPSILEINSWRDRRCFITAGGESIKDFNYTKLDGELTIGVNKSFLFYHPTLNYSMDITLIAEIMEKKIEYCEKSVSTLEKWVNYNGIRVFLSPTNSYETPTNPPLYFIRRREEPAIYSDINEGIYGGSNSGFGALMLAILMGANPIYLLGFDMQCRERTHCHGGYGKANVAEYNEKIKVYRHDFESFAPKIKMKGVRVVNLNNEDNTSLRCFPLEDVKSVLK